MLPTFCFQRELRLARQVDVTTFFTRSSIAHLQANSSSGYWQCLYQLIDASDRIGMDCDGAAREMMHTDCFMSSISSRKASMVRKTVGSMHKKKVPLLKLRVQRRRNSEPHVVYTSAELVRQTNYSRPC